MTTATTERTEAQWNALLERIKKVRALTESPNEHEATAAAAMLSKLVLQHNIDLASVDLGDAPNAELASFVREDFDLEYNIAWRGSLLHAVARVNFCRCVKWEGSKRVALVGASHNIYVTRQIYEYLAATVSRLADSEWRQHTAHNSRAWKNAFRMGCVSRIGERLREQHQADIVELKGSELVVTADANLKAAFASFFPNAKSGKSASVADSHGWAAGRAAGATVGLERQVAGAKPKAQRAVAGGNLALSSGH